MPKNNNYVLRPAQSWGPGVTQRKHIAEIFAKQPVMLENVVSRAFTANSGYLFSDFLKKHCGTKTFESDDEYQWRLVTSTYKNIPLIRAEKADGTTVTSSDSNIGVGGELIKLVFPEQYFALGEVIVGELNEYYQFRIVEEPTYEGTDVVYWVELMAGADTGCPAERLLSGERFSVEFSPVESELSRRVGGIRKYTPTVMRNEWTTIRKSMKFTGAANKQQRLDIDIPMKRINANGKEETTVIKSWFDNESWIFVNEWEREKERARFFSRSNRNTNGTYFNTGVSGLAIKEGDGIMAQMMQGHTQFYNDFDENFNIDGLANAIYEMVETANVPMSQRKFAVLTGQRGMIQVNKAIMKQTNGFGGTNWNFDATGLGVVSKVNNEVHQNSLAYGAQFVEYRAANGLVLTFIWEPALDNRERNKMSGPNGRGVLSSYAYYIMDLGTSAEPNMYMCSVEGMEDTFKYIIGMRNPFGITSEVISHDEDSASIHTMATLGAYIVDPTRCVCYLPADLIA